MAVVSAFWNRRIRCRIGLDWTTESATALARLWPPPPPLAVLSCLHQGMQLLLLSVFSSAIDRDGRNPLGELAS